MAGMDRVGGGRARVGALVFALAVLWTIAPAWAAEGGGSATEIANARAQLARAKATLVADEGLLQEAQAQPAGPERGELIQLAQDTVEKQRRAVGQAQQRLDALLGCTAARQQVELDQQASRRQLAASQALLAELDEWTRQNEEAQKKALEVARKALLDGALGFALAQVSGDLERAEKAWRQMPTDQYSELMMREVLARRRAIDSLKTARAELLTAKWGKGAYELWNALAGFVQSSRHTAAEISTLVRTLAGNKLVQGSAELAALQLASSRFEQRLIEAKFPLISDAAKLGNYLIDYGYEAGRWAASRARILEANRITEEQLAATAALGCQLERSMIRLTSCRGDRVPTLSGRCPASPKAAKGMNTAKESP